MNHKLLNLIIVLSFVKRIAHTNTYINVLPLIIGFLNIFRLKVNKYILILILIFPIYGYFLVYNALNPLEAFARNTQLLLLLMFSSYMVKILKDSYIKKIVIYSILLSGFLFFLELLFYYPNLHYYRDFFGLALYRFAGIVGEPNYTALLFVVLSIFSIYIKKYRYLFILFLFIFLTGSRASLLTFLILLIVNYFNLIKISKLGFYFLIIFPLFLFLNSWILFDNYEIMQALNTISSARMGVWWNYFMLIWENPFGYGAFQTQYLFGSGIEGSFFQKEHMQAHNLFLQFMADYGIYSYTVFTIIIFLWKKEDKIFLFLFPFVVNLYFLNPVNEIYLYVFLSLILIINKKNKETNI